jgi:type I restriction enzyme R subunit
MKFMKALNAEDSRAVGEGLDVETLAIFDLLKKEHLSANDLKRIKEVAVDLLATLKGEKLKIDQWRDKETTRAAVLVTIRDFLYNDASGLPSPAYSENDVVIKTDAVFKHVFYAYPRVPSPIYSHS